MDMKEHWAEINREAATIRDSTVFVVSVKRRDKHIEGGRVFLVKRQHAARLIVEGTHELASPEQVQEYQTREAAEQERLRAEQFKADQKYIIQLPETMVEAMKAGEAAKNPRGGK